MAAKKSNPEAFGFIVKALQADSKVAYADLKAKAEKKGLTIYPVMFGRAKAMLGLVKMAKRGQGKAAKAAAAKRGPGRPPGRRGPGRPPKSAGVAGLESVINALRDGDRERDRYRRALDQIRAIVEGV
jgi:hypothetical protein